MSSKNHDVNILIADDEEHLGDSLSFVLKQEGFGCKVARDGLAAYEIIQEENFDILISDIKMPKMNGLELIQKTREVSPQTMVVLITAFASVETAIEALRYGAVDYMLKPLDFDEVIMRINHLAKYRQLINENKQLRRQIEQKYDFQNIIGQSSAMQKVLTMVKKVSSSSTNVLVTGETGTGKELIARAIHANSDRNENPFIPVNCGAIPENLYESEFFGYKKGAFTGANQDYDGLFRSAHSGTLFLDEIGEVPEIIQVKLLRVLQEKELKPLGSNSTVKVDVRIIAATNKDLEEEVRKGNFREDLYYRLNVIEVKLPSLSERKDDIPLLVNYFIDKYNNELKKKISGVDNNVMKLLLQYQWKGNIRELENLIERAVLLSEGDVITLDELPAHMLKKNQTHDYPDNLNDAMEGYEKDHIVNILTSVEWNRSEAAKLLGVDPSTLYRKMQKLDIQQN